MTVPNQAAPGSSPTPTQAPTAAPTVDWEAKSKDLERQLQGLASERNRYKQQTDAWTRLAQDPRAAGAIRFDPATGLPVDWDINDPAPQYASAVPAQNPWGELGVDPNAASQWVGQIVQQAVQQGGYITQAQADQLASQKAALALQQANHRFATSRAVDKTLSNPSYKDLGDPNSEWAKRTASYLQQYQAGRPTREGAGWDEWDYTGPQVLQQAADIAYAQMVRESQATNASQQQAIQNQQAAGISAGPTTVPVPVAPEAALTKAVQNGGIEAGWEMIEKQTEANWQQKGLLK